MSGSFAPVSRISFISIARTSASVAVSDSQRISLRTVDQGDTPRGRRRHVPCPAGAAEVGDDADKVHADVDLPVGVGDLVDLLAWHRDELLWFKRFEVFGLNCNVLNDSRRRGDADRIFLE